MRAFRDAHQARDARAKLELRDEGGERIVAGRRSAARSITEAAMRSDVARDLETLLNTVNLGSAISLQGFDYVRRSILNFGFPDLAHRSIDEISVDDVKGELETVLIDFEPRLVSQSVRVMRDETLDPAELKVRFVVRAELYCEPVNAPIEFFADLELETGKILLNRL